jgi:hypothetical protein
VIKPEKKKEIKRKFERETKRAYRSSGFYLSLYENAKEGVILYLDFFLFVNK